MTREDIVCKQFSRAFLGYDAQEVDAFLDEIIRELDTLEQELSVSQMRTKLLAEELLKRTGRRKAEPAQGESASQPQEACAKNAEVSAADVAQEAPSGDGRNEHGGESTKTYSISGEDEPIYRSVKGSPQKAADDAVDSGNDDGASQR